MINQSKRVMLFAATMFALGAVVSVPVDARRGGSFGSRGARTYSSQRAPYGASGYVSPIERSMTQRARVPGVEQFNPGFGSPGPRMGSRIGGFGGGLLGGLVAGGLIGHFLGGGAGAGWGGGASNGLLLTLIQVAILAGVAWVAIGWLRRRSVASVPTTPNASYVGTPSYGAQPGPWESKQGTPVSVFDEQISITPTDQEAFELLLIDVQDAFGREDYAQLRAITTPEIMSFLSEELSQNAVQGLRNDVTSTHLIDAEVSEAWREASGDYATVALRYESIDVMRNRVSGEIVRGVAQMTPTAELWTFVRTANASWKLSAIQEA